jgi:uncharacterized protein (TIGR03435 family)
MVRIFAYIGSVALLSGTAFGQNTATQTAQAPPAFDIADVHVSPHTLTPNMRGGILRAGRYEIRTATMVDLIRTAYNMDADKVLSGPSWLESDRFDVVAKAPASTSTETAKLMLQTLLGDRFKLVVHPDSHSLPGFALTVGKGGAPKLKAADGSGETGCKYTIPPPPPRPTTAQAGVPVLIVPNYLYECKNMTMAAFAEAMHTMIGAQGYLDTGLVTDNTGLKGAWDFNFKYGPRITGPIAALVGADTETTSLFDAVDKQLGLKLDPTKIATPVLIVDSVNRKPTDNPPGVITSLPEIPAEFEVADIKLSEPGAAPVASQGFQPGGRVNLRNFPLITLINLALNPAGPDMLVGVPKGLDSVRVDLVAKMPSSGLPVANQGIDLDALRPALKALLIERFKMTLHTEDRPVNAYRLVAAKPKLQKTTDPLMRTGCKEGPGPDGKDPRVGNPLISRLLSCQNMTMAEFAEQLPLRAGGYLRSEVLDATGLDGAYDFTLSFSANGLPQLVAGRGAEAAGGATASASDPAGGLSLFEAVNKQLGLKLEQEKRSLRVIVIDHIEEKPTDN